ncbi:MAG: hypothetical protein IJ225_09445 [Solobacterium sp.]|nr:hypothetical protein [Solobacterium sp.]
MNKLDELIAKLRPGSVDYFNLAGVAAIDRDVQVVRNQLAQENGCSVYQNSLIPLGLNQNNCPKNTTFVIGAGDIGYSTVPFWAIDDCLYIYYSSKSTTTDLLDQTWMNCLNPSDVEYYGVSGMLSILAYVGNIV